jgi:ribosomal protein S18 acetylase RimI-like enzyme
MKAKIRRFTPRDHRQATELWRSCEGLGLTDSDSYEGIRAFLRRNPGLSFVAESDGQIVGTALCGHDGRRGFIYHLAVAPSARREGIGRTLVARCLARLQSFGISKCHIVVYARNRAGRQFWRQTEWVERTELTLMSKPTA